MEAQAQQPASPAPLTPHQQLQHAAELDALQQQLDRVREEGDAYRYTLVQNFLGYGQLM